MEKKSKRVWMSVLGVLVCGISVGFLKRASMGIDPFQSLMSGLDAVIPIRFGTLYVLANVCLLLFSLVNDRSKIGMATVLNLLFLGYVVDFSHKTLLYLFPELSLMGRVIMLIIGIVLLCLSSAFYFTADLGVSTYDAVALVAAEKWKIAPFKVCRIATDLICVILGSVLYLCSGKSLAQLGELIGIGTIITAFFMGPLIDFFNVHVARPFLDR